MHSKYLLAVYLCVGAFISKCLAAAFVNFETPHVHPIALSPDNELLAVCNTADYSVEVFQFGNDGIPKLRNSIFVGIDPVSVRFRTNNELWVVNQLSDSISIINLNTNRVYHTLNTADEPADVVFTSYASDQEVALVSCSSVDTIQVFLISDLDVAPTSLPIAGEDPRAMVVDGDGNVHVAIFESGNGTTILGGGAAESTSEGEGTSAGESTSESGSCTRIEFPPNIVSDSAGPYGGDNPPPNDGNNFNPSMTALNPPPVGLIVREDNEGKWKDDNGRDWSEFVDGNQAELSGRIEDWGLIDNDIATIKMNPISGYEIAYHENLMTMCMALSVNPTNGKVTLVGTESRNEVRFEPNLKASFSKVLFATTDANDTSAAATITDLNPHLAAIEYDFSRMNEITPALSIGDPRAIAWYVDSLDNTKAFIAGMGSNNVIVVDADGERISGLEPIKVGQGPTGIVVDQSRRQVYVLNRFDATISTIDAENYTIDSTLAFFDPTPEAIKLGRPFLYDTHLSSKSGHLSCASCHVDARTDRLAWDLGVPNGSDMPISSSQNLGNNILGLNGANGADTFTAFHPMKGPMTTQTLQDIIGKEPHHWRGDKSGIESFNGIFVSLLGRENPLKDDEMSQLKDYLATITIPPNPYRTLQNELPTDLKLTAKVQHKRFDGYEPGHPLPNGNALRGFKDLYTQNQLDSGAFECITCHTAPTGMSSKFILNSTGEFVAPENATANENHALVAVDGSTQRAFKTPQLRTLYDKLGFDLSSKSSRSGFGLLHDGSVDGLSRFLSQKVFNVKTPQQLADLIALMLAFSGSDFPNPTTEATLLPPGSPSLDAHAAVGSQVTCFLNDAPPKLNTLIELANADEIDLVAHTAHETDHLPYSWYYTDSKFRASEAKIDDVELSDLPDNIAITFTAVPTGSGERLGIDRDGDGLRDYDEEKDLDPSSAGHQNPFSSRDRDSTGDNVVGTNGKIDGEDDFDGDGVTNKYELEAGTNPAKNLSGFFPLNLSITVTNANEFNISWNPAPLGRYKLESSSNLVDWYDENLGTEFIGDLSTPPTRLDYTFTPTSSTSSHSLDHVKRFFRVIRTR